MMSVFATTLPASHSAPAPFKSPLPLREGGRGRGFVPPGPPFPGGPDTFTTPDHQQRHSAIDNPLPLPPSRKGRGDSGEAMPESGRARARGDRR